MITRACNACGSQIGFIETPAGKHMPVDPELVQTFTVQEAITGSRRLVLVTEKGIIAKGFEVSLALAGAEPLEGYVPHWSTRTKPAQFRRPT